MAGDKSTVKYKIQQDAKKRGRLGSPDFKLHFIACLNERVDVAEKQWNIRVRKTNLKFGRHGFYSTIKLKLI